MPSLSLYLLGPPRIVLDDAPLHFGRRRTLAISIYLAVTNCAHHRDQLTAIFWPETEARRARTNLRRVLHQINQAFGPGWLVTENDTVRFQRNEPLWIDAERFSQQLVVCLDHCPADGAACEDCLSALAEAVDLYTNDFLAGFTLPDSPDFDHWQYYEGESLRDELAYALERLVSGHTALEQYEQAIAYARRWLSFDELHEPVHRWLMQLYAWEGRQVDALRQYERCVELFASELGVPPAKETETLYEAIKGRRLSPLVRRPVAGELPEEPARDDIRVVTVLSIGLVDSESTIGTTSLDATAEAVHTLQAIVEEISLSYAGRVESISGGELLVFFGTDHVHEDDAERGVRVALAVLAMTKEQSLPIHVGADTGMVYCRRKQPQGLTVMGRVVSRASQLRSQAATGQILADRATVQAAGGICDYQETTLRRQGGEPGNTIYAILRLRAQQVKKRGIEGLQARLIGREREMRSLTVASDMALAGHGRLVAIEAEAGVGKSRLVAELRQYVASMNVDAVTGAVPVCWLEGRSLSMSTDVGYWLFADLLRSHHEEIDGAALAAKVRSELADLRRHGHLSDTEYAEVGPLFGWLVGASDDEIWDTYLSQIRPDQMRRRMVDAVQRYLIALARKQPLVLVLEDLHWADSGSLDVIDGLMDCLEQAPMLVICLYRPCTDRRGLNITTKARSRIPDRLLHIRLDSLTPEQSRLQILSLLGDDSTPNAAVKPILSRAQGNPLFTEEIVRSLLESQALVRQDGVWHVQTGRNQLTVPLQLQSIVHNRIDNLAAVPRRCLQAAAVFGRVFRSELLTAMLTDVPSVEESLQRLIDQGFIHLERYKPAAEYSFRHVLVQEAVYQRLTGQQRQALHSFAADALERTYAQHLEPYVEEIARHHELGREPVKALPYLLLSGQKAQGVYLNEMALTYYRRAQTLYENHDDVAVDQRYRLAILRGVGECLVALGKSKEAEATLRQAIRLAASLDRPVSEQVRCYFPLCQMLRWLGRFDDLLLLGQKGMALLGDDSVSPEAVMLTAYLASASYLTGKRRRYRSLVELTIDALRDMEYGAHLVTAYGTAAWWYRDAKRSSEGRLWLDRLLHEAERRGDHWTLGHLYASPGYWLPEASGDWATVWANIERLSVLAEKTGDPVLRAYAYTYLGHLNWLAGILDTAGVMYAKALAIPFQNQISLLHLLSRAGSGWVLLAQGDVAGAITALEQALDDATAIRYRVHGMQMARLSLARTYTMVGRDQEAVSLYRLVAVEDEVDSDGQMWIASALAGLERLQTDAADFERSCRHIVRQRNAADLLHLVQWQLTKCEHSLSAGPRDIGDTGGLRHSWQWFNPYEDCSYAVDDAGVTIWAANHYRDIWFGNHSAPRLLQPVQGDFAMEARCRLHSSDMPALGGLLLWADERNFLRLDWNIDGPGSVSLRGSIDNHDRLLGRGLLPAGDEAVLRLERHGDHVRALCSPGGQRWYRVAEIKFPMIDPAFVGPFASGAISRWFYCGAFTEGTAIRFEAIRLFEIAQ